MRSSLIIRTSLFIIVFLLLSGWYGSWIVGTRLLYPFYFFIYGNLGKVILFSFITFAVIAGKEALHLTLPKYEIKNIIYLLVAGILSILFPFIAKELLTFNKFSDNILLGLATHAFVIALPILLVLGIFGMRFWTIFLRRFNKQILQCFLLAIGIYAAIFYIWELWPFFSNIVLKSILFLFSLTRNNVIYFPPRTIFVDKFAVTIDQACSGLESFLLFTVLSGLIVYVDKKKLDFKKFTVFYILGMIGTFMVNILRVYGIIWTGLLFSPRLAATLFHTYLGMVLFILFFIAYFRLGYRRIKSIKNTL